MLVNMKDLLLQAQTEAENADSIDKAAHASADALGQLMKSGAAENASTLRVIDGEGRYQGTISEGDFLWNLIRDFHMDLESMRRVKVSYMKRRWNYKAVSIDAEIGELADLILDQNFVPVVDGRNVFIGIVTRKVIMQALLQNRQEKQEDE